MGDCPFCFRENFEERIIAEDSDFYAIATLGQITSGGYVLLFPKHHIRCIAGLAMVNIGILETWKNHINHAVIKEYSSCTFMCEHGIVGQTVGHAHLHIIPAKFNPMNRIKLDFPGTRLETLNSLSDIKERYLINPSPYLLWKSASDHWRVCWDPPAPKQYFRTILASEIGCPERADWQTMHHPLDKHLCRSTVSRLKPYFS